MWVFHSTETDVIRLPQSYGNCSFLHCLIARCCRNLCTVVFCRYVCIFHNFYRMLVILLILFVATCLVFSEEYDSVCQSMSNICELRAWFNCVVQNCRENPSGCAKLWTLCRHVCQPYASPRPLPSTRSVICSQDSLVRHPQHVVGEWQRAAMPCTPASCQSSVVVMRLVGWQIGWLPIILSMTPGSQNAQNSNYM